MQKAINPDKAVISSNKAVISFDKAVTSFDKVAVGIDISSKEFHACIKKRLDGAVKTAASRSFANNKSGFDALLVWVNKHNKDQQPVSFLMEATGVYYENLAYYLHEAQLSVAVVLANKMKAYFKSLNIKTKTDKVDAAVIASYGLERKLEIWQPVSAQYQSLRDLCRALLLLKKDRQRAKSQLHALQAAHQKHPGVITILQEQADFYQQQASRLLAAIKQQVNQDRELKARLEKLTTIPGIGFETAIMLISETNGFLLFSNSRQLISYAGLDISHNQSGSFKGSSRISKKGNTRIRQVLYMPALAACRANEPVAALYERVCLKNPHAKRKGVVAAMRKLLIVAYAVWKKDEAYEAAYKWGKNNGEKENAGMKTSANEEAGPSLGSFSQKKINSKKKAEPPRAPH